MLGYKLTCYSFICKWKEKIDLQQRCIFIVAAHQHSRLIPSTKLTFLTFPSSCIEITHISLSSGIVTWSWFLSLMWLYTRRLFLLILINVMISQWVELIPHNKFNLWWYLYNVFCINQMIGIYFLWLSSQNYKLLIKI